MDHFESIIQTLLEVDGYWVRSSYKVNLTKEEKVKTGKHSIPRPEIDLLAYNARKDELLVYEVKSFLDSLGVKLSDLSQSHDLAEGRYKLFTSKRYRDIVMKRLKKQLLEQGAITSKTKICLGLVAGKIYGGDSAGVKKYLDGIGCCFLSPEQIKQKIHALAKSGYENNAATITAKILMR